jgi:ABC-type sugar transport system ATPase subunit
VHLPGDRHAKGVFMALSVRENLSALVLDRLPGLLRRSLGANA